MTVKSALLILLGSLIPSLFAGCETTTTEKSNYALTDGKSDSILDSRIRQLETEAIKYPLRSDLHYSIASLHAKKGDCAESAKALEKAISISPDEGKYHFHLGRLFLTMRDLDRAEKEFRTALSLSREGRYTGPHAALAWTLSLKKQNDAAIEQFEKCIRIDPENPIFYYWLGATHDIQGHREKAIHNFREYLARGGTTYRSKAVNILQSLGVAPADIPDAPLSPRNEDLLGAPLEEDLQKKPRDSSLDAPSPPDAKPVDAKPVDAKSASTQPAEAAAPKPGY